MAPVVMTLETEDPLIVPNRPEVMTATLAGPPVIAPGRGGAEIGEQPPRAAALHEGAEHDEDRDGGGDDAGQRAVDAARGRHQPGGLEDLGRGEGPRCSARRAAGGPTACRPSDDDDHPGQPDLDRPARRLQQGHDGQDRRAPSSSGAKGSTYSMRSADHVPVPHHPGMRRRGGERPEPVGQARPLLRRRSGKRRVEQEQRRHEDQQVEAAHGDRLGEAEAAEIEMDRRGGRQPERASSFSGRPGRASSSCSSGRVAVLCRLAPQRTAGAARRRPARVRPASRRPRGRPWRRRDAAAGRVLPRRRRVPGAHAGMDRDQPLALVADQRAR